MGRIYLLTHTQLRRWSNYTSMLTCSQIRVGREVWVNRGVLLVEVSCWWIGDEFEMMDIVSKGMCKTALSRVFVVCAGGVACG